MNTSLPGLALAAACSLAIVTAPVSAQQANLVEVGIAGTDSASERIELSGKLRMLSQRIPSAACHLERGIETEAATEVLASATQEFDRILDALEFGDSELNIQSAEPDRRTVALIQSLREQWTPFKNASNALLAPSASKDEMDLVLAENMALLESANTLVVKLTAEYANPATMLQSNSMVIDIAGRQHMLTQKMSKEACLVAAQPGSTDPMEQLSSSVEMFEASLNALRHGMQAAGIAPPPTKEISAGLEAVAKDWASVKPLIDEIIAGADIDKAKAADKFNLLNTTMKDMNEVVKLYSEAASQNL